jgi:hypothetical protein
MPEQVSLSNETFYQFHLLSIDLGPEIDEEQDLDLEY